jgi:hypothetical protein
MAVQLLSDYNNWYHDILPGYYNPPVNQYYTQIYVNLEKSQIGMLIGKNGIIFKEITVATGVSYIWYNGLKNIIEIWGPNEYNLHIAVEKIQERLKYINIKTRENLVNMYDVYFPSLKH